MHPYLETSLQGIENSLSKITFEFHLNTLSQTHRSGYSSGISNFFIIFLKIEIKSLAVMFEGC